MGCPELTRSNGASYWRNIPERVWELKIGGYQVIKEWLSYREHSTLDRALTEEEVAHVQATAGASPRSFCSARSSTSTISRAQQYDEPTATMTTHLKDLGMICAVLEGFAGIERKR